ncbi:uncharacterized protein LOC129617954 [Condylostylus longicornis]|uniref:uncharacterized protein LOC129617954 n=1 Tax=Condylostylus longicornis TaxID=2530218 RepID=UPI00244DB118|nr:uncharacterized protein LOC129617954 [Condylostylus longicornis]
MNEQIEEKARGLFALARLTGSSSSTTPGACRKCGQVGHLPFQCRNYLSLNDSSTTSKKPSTLGLLLEGKTEKWHKNKSSRRHKEKRSHRRSPSDDSSSEDRKRR